ncbi:Uncharacterised protein [Sphingobacterium daejeonense]|mgnify:CR=1 FL=1|nr:Uncharacterised protein [Sphingobacterium daejeonense]
MKYPESTKLEAVVSIVSGELYLEEAMSKYNIKDKRTVIMWMKKLLPQARSSISSLKS